MTASIKNICVNDDVEKLKECLASGEVTISRDEMDLFYEAYRYQSECVMRHLIKWSGSKGIDMEDLPYDRMWSDFFARPFVLPNKIDILLYQHRKLIGWEHPRFIAYIARRALWTGDVKFAQELEDRHTISQMFRGAENIHPLESVTISNSVEMAQWLVDRMPDILDLLEDGVALDQCLRLGHSKMISFWLDYLEKNDRADIMVKAVKKCIEYPSIYMSPSRRAIASATGFSSGFEGIEEVFIQSSRAIKKDIARLVKEHPVMHDYVPSIKAYLTKEELRSVVPNAREQSKVKKI